MVALTYPRSRRESIQFPFPEHITTKVRFGQQELLLETLVVVVVINMTTYKHRRDDDDDGGGDADGWLG